MPINHHLLFSVRKDLYLQFNRGRKFIPIEKLINLRHLTKNCLTVADIKKPKIFITQKMLTTRIIQNHQSKEIRNSSYFNTSNKNILYRTQN